MWQVFLEFSMVSINYVKFVLLTTSILLVQRKSIFKWEHCKILREGVLEVVEVVRSEGLLTNLV